MTKKIKTIVAVVLCSVGVLWLIPTVFVETTALEITECKLLREGETQDRYEISFTYLRGTDSENGTYTEVYPKGWAPSEGGQEVCHYYTVPPFSVHIGDAPSPVPPLCCIVIGLLLPMVTIPRWIKSIFAKKEKPHEQ